MLSGSEMACSNLNSEPGEIEWKTIIEAAGVNHQFHFKEDRYFGQPPAFSRQA
jgi:hypothetical protein